jgi:hypothetical protein
MRVRVENIFRAIKLCVGLLF